MHKRKVADSISQAERASFVELCKWLQQRTALHFPPSKQATLLSRLYQLCTKLNLPDLASLYQCLCSGENPDLLHDLIDTVTTNHTYFFREEIVWTYFKEKIIPSLKDESHWRIWSAASSSGEEAYTMSIILAEMFGVTRMQQLAAILGTDLSPPAVATAEAGNYKWNMVKTTPESVREKYFKKINDDTWRINAELKQICTFRRLNLKSDVWPFSKKFHVIVCRNVLYYFDQADQQKLIERLYDETAPGGWLLTSVSESLRALNTRWQCQMAGVYRKE